MSISPQAQLEREDPAATDKALADLHAQREQTVRDDVARRLRPVCADLPEDDFMELVRQIAERQIRQERRLVW